MNRAAENVLFQFPTNGKVHVNLVIMESRPEPAPVTVSIPYERESTCERLYPGVQPVALVVGFNSLRAGKYM